MCKVFIGTIRDSCVQGFCRDDMTFLCARCLYGQYYEILVCKVFIGTIL